MSEVEFFLEQLEEAGLDYDRLLEVDMLLTGALDQSDLPDEVKEALQELSIILEDKFTEAAEWAYYNEVHDQADAIGMELQQLMDDHQDEAGAAVAGG